MKTIVYAALLAALAWPALAQGQKVHNYHCNGIPLGPCALPESRTQGVIQWCRNIPYGNGTYDQQCTLIRVIRD